MRQIAVLALLLVGVALIGTKQSTAQTTTFNGYCFTGAYTTLTPCPTSPTPTRALIIPNKSLAVTGPVAAPAGTSSYTVNLTSQLACFSLNEPINVYTMGGSSAAALTPLYPSYYVQHRPDAVTIHPDKAGQASLALEVFKAAVGPAGLLVKAVWPEEHLEKYAQVIAPAPTITVTPGGPTVTPTAAPTATPTSTPTATPGGTPAPTVVATLAAGALTVRTCVDPNPMIGAVNATLYAQTLPGAVCSASVVYSDGSVPSDFNGSAQTALSDGFDVWTWHENTKAAGGTAKVTCALAGQTATSSTKFTVLQPAQATATAATP